MKKLLSIIYVFIVASCSNVNFIYNDDENLVNPLYEKTVVSTSGEELVFINSYVPMIFGKAKEESYKLLIYIEEKKTKLSVETNQATSNLRHELRFKYSLHIIKKDCVAFEKTVVSNFTIIPKSAGYNFGTDASLEKKYELAITSNLNQFLSYISGDNINDCI